MRGKQLHTAYFFVDYSAVDDLRTQTLAAVVSDHDVRLSSPPGGLIGKIVMLGNIQWDSTLDKYPVPPWQIVTPGVYLHASAIYTLIEGPLLEITTAGRAVLDVFFAVGVLGIVWGLRMYYARQREVAAHRMNVLFTCLAVLAVFTLGYGFLQCTRILWLDFVLVSAALVIHSVIEGQLEDFGERISAIWHRIVFVESRKGEPS
jgi:CHASE2 domain.